MQPISLTVPADQAAAIAAEVQRPPGFDAADHDPLVRVWIGPSLELVMTLAAADRLADALVDALAADDEQAPVTFPALVNGW
jgi:hypothetical protein